MMVMDAFFLPICADLQLAAHAEAFTTLPYRTLICYDFADLICSRVFASRVADRTGRSEMGRVS